MYTSHKPNRMTIRENKGFCSFAFDSASTVSELDLRGMKTAYYCLQVTHGLSGLKGCSTRVRAYQPA